MKIKKSRIELAREIIANLRRGMNREPKTESVASQHMEATPFTPAPLAHASARPSRRPLNVSHSHS